MTDDKKDSLDNPKVEVRAEPDYDEDHSPDWDYIDKVEESVKQDVEQALEEAEDKGSGAQIGAANDAVDDASEKVDPNRIDKIHVDIEDDDGRHVEIHREARGRDR